MKFLPWIKFMMISSAILGVIEIMLYPIMPELSAAVAILAILMQTPIALLFFPRFRSF